MYPKVHTDIFRSFDRKAEVFVSIPFAKRFDYRWDNIFKPAINECGLKPYRLKEKVGGDSIPFEILDGIGRSKLILVDISNEFQDKNIGFPNSNVMYELGIAHSIRLPEEVIIVRDKNSCQIQSPFDIRHIRWNEFSEKSVSKSKVLIKNLLKNAIKEVDLTKDRMVTVTLNKLDVDAISFLHAVRSYEDGFDLQAFDPDRKGLYALPNGDCTVQELKSIARNLIELGVLQSSDKVIPYWQRIYGCTCEYRLTQLGKSIIPLIPKNLDERPYREKFRKYMLSLGKKLKRGK